MTSRARHLLVATLAAIPLVAWTGAASGHNGRSAPPPAPVEHKKGITVTVDPKTGVRSYTQTGAVAPNPALAKLSPVKGALGPGVDYWVRQSSGSGGGGHASSDSSGSGGSHEPAESSYSDSYASTESDYVYGGGYLPAYGYGGGGDWNGRPGHGGGGGRPGRPGGGGGGEPPASSGDGGYNLPPRSGWSPPPGPPGGGIGSPPPRQDAGIGAPPPRQPLRASAPRGRR